ncbi:MAG: thioredoxin-dependent thiol peroxidase [Actinobacteria bacterium]|uniref:thioredoxin-dependent peroxiredoxin n=1 Tax=freshwater metagenome TaxID=449393 RepID=A0A6J7GC09_9ZZZZ|nr:thioredoxin-dependent thiol peroxidase [Actinomycetota bacterium]
MALEIKDTAPAFALKNDAGETIRLSQFKGKRVILYFYPAALTPGCTKQACDFTDNLKLFNSLDFVIIGISPDKPEKLAKFREQEGLKIILLSDPEKEVLTKYGAYGEKKLYGKTVVGVIRSTFVISPTGKVEHAFYNVKATGHVAKLIRDLALT